MRRFGLGRHDSGVVERMFSGLHAGPSRKVAPPQSAVLYTAICRWLAWSSRCEATDLMCMSAA
eukprot:scaffold25703_cov35-Tisochrysis_lutea.AAC.1